MRVAKKIAYISAVSAMLAVSAQISIPLPFLVPVTLQLLVVIAAGLILGPNLGAAAVLVYLVAGLAGLPVFANFGGGLQYVFKPSFGFLLGFVPCVYITGLISRNTASQQRQNAVKRKSVSAVCLNYIKLLPALFVLYAVGLTYQFLILRYYLGYTAESAFTAILASLAVFFFADMLKIVPLACANNVLVTLNKRFRDGLDFYG